MDQETTAKLGQGIQVELYRQKRLIQVSQIAIYPFLLIMRIFLVRNQLQRNSVSIGSREKAFVIYGNHQSKLDPLILCACLPFSAIKKLIPFRFFVANIYMKGPMKFFLYIMGGFPAHYKTSGMYGLDLARTYLATDQTIVIFPPGKRTRERVAKSGIAQLAIEPNVQLIPIHINWNNRWSCSVNIGAPVFWEDTTNPLPEQLMQRVYELS